MKTSKTSHSGLLVFPAKHVFWYVTHSTAHVQLKRKAEAVSWQC